MEAVLIAIAFFIIGAAAGGTIVLYGIRDEIGRTGMLTIGRYCWRCTKL